MDLSQNSFTTSNLSFQGVSNQTIIGYGGMWVTTFIFVYMDMVGDGYFSDHKRVDKQAGAPFIKSSLNARLYECVSVLAIIINHFLFTRRRCCFVFNK